MRFTEEAGGGGVRAALLQTSAAGEPLGFHFTRVDMSDPALTHGARGRQRASAFLAGSLFRSVVPSPTLILGLADEAPAPAFAGNVPAELRFCRVAPFDVQVRSASGGTNERRARASWATEESNGESAACRLFDVLMQRDDPLEPFDRAAAAMVEAFADERVRNLSAVCGLTTVVSLSALRDRAGYETDRSADGDTAKSSRAPRGGMLAERLWAVLAAPPARSCDELVTRLDWAGELMPFQQEGVRALVDNDRLLLADDMGLGKTVQAIAAVRILRASGTVRSCLVAAPAGLLDQWRREIAKWAPELTAIIIRGSASDRGWQWAAPVDVTLISYDTLRSDAGGKPHAPVRARQWDVVVADEAQRIKNRNDTSHALKGLRRTRSWALTGTPIENHEGELASILEFVDHDAAGASRSYQPGVELLTRHRELQLRRRKVDVLDDLPPKQTTRVPIDLKPRQRDSYDKAEREGIVYLRSLGTEVGVRHVLELITRLKQICNADPRTGESSKLEDIRDRLARLSAQGHKALVFSQYANESSGVAAVANYLREFNPLTLTGDMTQEERSAAIGRFRTSGGHRVLALSLRAGGLGLNLQEASYVFHLDRWWNPAVERQAEDRSHRMGQAVKVNVIKYSCTDTMEERIDAILERKQSLFDELIDDVSLDLSTLMNRQELFGLFGL